MGHRAPLPLPARAWRRGGARGRPPWDGVNLAGRMGPRRSFVKLFRSGIVPASACFSLTPELRSRGSEARANVPPICHQRLNWLAFTASSFHSNPTPGTSGMWRRLSLISYGFCRTGSAQSCHSSQWAVSVTRIT